jgi:hypothetical protein
MPFDTILMPLTDYDPPVPSAFPVAILQGITPQQLAFSSECWAQWFSLTVRNAPTLTLWYFVR